MRLIALVLLYAFTTAACAAPCTDSLYVELSKRPIAELSQNEDLSRYIL